MVQVGYTPANVPDYWDTRARSLPISVLVARCPLQSGTMQGAGLGEAREPQTVSSPVAREPLGDRRIEAQQCCDFEPRFAEA